MRKPSTLKRLLPQEIINHYEGGIELHRLSQGTGQLELARTQEIIKRYLSPPGIILDIGGGPGIYACWLAKQGYEVHLIDATPLHIDQARHASHRQPHHPIASITLGDARKLNWKNASVDAVLLMGPLYHLTERKDRIKVLREVKRVLKKNGVVITACVSRFAPILEGMVRGYLNDPAFVKIAHQDLLSGQHRNPDNHPNYFTSAFFHTPTELRKEIKDSGLRVEKVLAVEGPAWLLQNFEVQWRNPKRKKRLLDAVKWLEEEESILGISAHILCIAKK